MLLIIPALYLLTSGWNHLTFLDQISYNKEQMMLKCDLQVSGVENIRLFFFLLNK